MADFDIVVLGGGPGGYASALYAASAGLSVAMVEKEKVGGTCLHRGCIPAKALLHAAEVFRTVNHAGEHGVKLPDGGEPEPDWPAANKRRAGIVNQLHRGLSGLLKRRKVHRHRGARAAHRRRRRLGQRRHAARARRRSSAPARCPASIPGMDVDGRTRRDLRPRHQQRRAAAAGAGRGDRRRGDRRGVRVGLHRHGCADHAARGAGASGAADRAGPRRRQRARAQR